VEGAAVNSYRMQFLFLIACLACSSRLAIAQSSSPAMAPKLNEQQFAGEGLFLQNCSFCHYEHKMGSQSTVHGNVQNPKSTEPGISICPDLKTILHRSNPTTDRALRAEIQRGFPFKMPGFQYSLEPAEIDSIIAYLRTF
jgi:hypothetical protein